MIFYTNKLGCTLEWEYGDPPGYAGVKFGTADIHLSENPDVTNTGESVWLYIMVEDVDTLYNGLVANGVDVDGPPSNARGGCVSSTLPT